MSAKDVGRFLGTAIIGIAVTAIYFVAVSYFARLFYVAVMTPVLHLREPLTPEGPMIAGMTITLLTAIGFLVWAVERDNS